MTVDAGRTENSKWCVLRVILVIVKVEITSLFKKKCLQASFYDIFLRKSPLPLKLLAANQLQHSSIELNG